MATTTENIVYKVDIDAGNSVKTLEQMNVDLSRMKASLSNIPIGSKEFDVLKTKIKTLDSDIKNINKSFEGIDTEALAGEIGKFAGGVGQVTASFVLLGGEGNKTMEELQKDMNKAIGLVMAIKGATEVWTSATKLMVPAQEALNAAMKANPIGIIITGIAALAVGIIYLVKQLNKEEDTLNKVNAKQEQYNNLKKEADDLLVNNKSIEERYSIVDKLNDRQLKKLKDDIDTQVALYEDLDAKIIAKTKKILEEDKELKDLQLLYEKANINERINIAANINLRKKVILNNEIDLYEENERKKIDLIKKSNNIIVNDNKGKNKEILQDEQKTSDEIIKLRLDPYYKFKTELNDVDKLRESYNEKAINYIEEYNNSLYDAQQQEISNTDKKYNELTKSQEVFNGETYEIVKADEENIKQLEILYKEELDKIDKKYSDLRLQRRFQENDMMLKTTEDLFSSMEQIANAFGERGTIAAKGFALAQITIDTAKAISAAVSTGAQVGLTPFEKGLAIAGNIAIVLANIAKAMQVINSVKYAKGGILNGPSHAQGGIMTQFGELEGGEAVINKRSTRAFAPVLSKLNEAGGGKVFASGDIIDYNKLAAALSTQQVVVTDRDITNQQTRTARLLDRTRI